MKRGLAFFISIICFSGVFAIDIPPGGVNMIDDAILNHTKVGGPGSVSVVNAEHAEFTKALRIDVTSVPDNYWNFQVVFKTNAAIEKDDVCLVSLWARTTYSASEAGEGLLTAIEEHKDTYSKPLSHTFTVGGQWTHLFYAYKSDQTLPLEKHKAALFFGHAVQTIEIANVQFLNYKNTKTLDELPTMPITYDGMKPDAPWRAEANQRIEKFRKGNVTVKLVDKNNQPVANSSVLLKMKKHRFGFGSAIDGQTYLSNPVYRKYIHELFNEVVFENDLKWKPWPNKANHNYVLQAIDSLQKHTIRVRGHNLIWPGWNHLPGFMKLYQNNPSRLIKECTDHIDEAVNLTKNKVVDWDVINEPYTNHDLMDILGDEIMADWFKQTKETDPNVKCYINDYSILGNGGTDKNHQDHYFATIKFIDDNGGEIDGIGMQSHFAELVTGIPKVLEILDRFSVYNKEIKITEFDINSLNDSLKVNYTRDFMTVLFSYPYVKGILCWGFWEGRHWRPNAAYYNLDWSIRPQGEMYKNLVFDNWWTQAQSQLSMADGNANFGSCFLGDYEISYTVNGKSNTIEVPVNYNLENNITINTETGEFAIEGSENEDTPVFTSVKNIRKTHSQSLLIYPNPAKNFIKFELVGFAQNSYNYQVFDSIGNCLINNSQTKSGQNIISLSGFKTGMYFLAVNSNGKRLTKRFVVR